MCMTFGYNPQINFCHFFQSLNLVNFGLKPENITRYGQDETQPSFLVRTYEPRSEKTGLRGIRPGPTQTGLYNHNKWLEASNFEFR